MQCALADPKTAYLPSHVPFNPTAFLYAPSLAACPDGAACMGMHRGPARHGALLTHHLQRMPTQTDNADACCWSCCWSCRWWGLPASLHTACQTFDVTAGRACGGSKEVRAALRRGSVRRISSPCRILYLMDIHSWASPRWQKHFQGLKTQYVNAQHPPHREVHWSMSVTQRGYGHAP